MTLVEILYWRDIPAQVKARSGRLRAARQLSDRFQEAIDEAAMRIGASDSDDYLAEWRTSEPREQDGLPESVADAVAAELEAAYPPERLRQLIAAGGRDQGGEP